MFTLKNLARKGLTAKVNTFRPEKKYLKAMAFLDAFLIFFYQSHIYDFFSIITIFEDYT